MPHLLPDPEKIRALESMAPGTGAKLFDLFTSEVEHRRDLALQEQAEQQRAAQRRHTLEITGLWLGFAIGCIAMGCATGVALFASQPTQQLAAGLLGGGGVIGLVTVFVRRSRAS